jgi:hypothetical protein
VDEANSHFPLCVFELDILPRAIATSRMGDAERPLGLELETEISRRISVLSKIERRIENWAAMAAYMAAAMFASTEYNLFPYFMVGYICAVYQIASPQGVSTSPQDETSSGGKGKWKWWKTRAGTGLESLTTSWLSCAAWSVTTGWISVLMDLYVPAVESSIPR